MEVLKWQFLLLVTKLVFFFHQSDATPYSMKALKWKDGKGDILRDFKTTCEKYGILPGVYIGTRWNSFYGIYDFKVQAKGNLPKIVRSIIIQ